MNVFKLIAVVAGAGIIIIQSIFIVDNHYAIKGLRSEQTALTESMKTISSQLEEVQAGLDSVHESRTRQVDETAIALEELQEAQEALEENVDQVKNFLGGNSANFQ